MGLLFELETRLEQELPLRIQGTLKESLGQYRPRCHECGLVNAPHAPLLTVRRHPLWGAGSADSSVPLWGLPQHDQWCGTAGGRGTLPAVLNKLQTGP